MIMFASSAACSHAPTAPPPSTQLTLCHAPAHHPASTQNPRKAPTFTVLALLLPPPCASLFTLLNSPSSVRFFVSEKYSPPVNFLFFATRLALTSPIARSSLLSP